MKRFLVITALLFMAFVSYAQQSVFEYVEGEVTLKRLSGELVDAMIGDSVSVGDSIITGLDGFAELSLENSSKITIDNDTVFIFSQKEKKEEKKSIFMVVLGKIGFKFDRLLQEPDIQTPATVAGIRGTEFTVVSALDGSSLYIVDDGSVAVEAEGTLVVLETREGVEVPLGSQPGDKFEVKVGNVDFSGWLSDGEKRFDDDPAGALTGITAKLVDYSEEVDDYYKLYENSNGELIWMRAEMSSIEKEKGADARSDYYKSEVFPKEMETSNLVLNYRYYALSALSLRRYVVSSMYVQMKTKFILDKTNSHFISFIDEYERFLMIYEKNVVPYLVEADI